MSRRVGFILACLSLVAGLAMCNVSVGWIDLPTDERFSDAALSDDAPAPDPASIPPPDGVSETDMDPPQAATTGATPIPAANAEPSPIAPTATLVPRPSTTPTPNAPPTPRPALPPLPNTLNVVLLGSDHRPGASDWRTDTIIVVMIDPQSKQVGVVSVHRDIWVNIPGRAANRVNTLDEFGGPPLVKKVLGATLGIPIDYYVRIDFDGMVKAIDAIGGVTIDADCPFMEYFPDPRAPGGTRTLKISQGRVKLTGQMALDYSRSRLSSSVSDRMKRQMHVLLGVREKLLSADTFPRIPELWNVTSKLVQTDLPPTMIVPLAKLAAETKLGNAHGLAIGENMARQTTSTQGWWILLPDLTAVRTATRNVFSAKPLMETVKKAGC
ncbi:MAG: LCP family protein [Chloroflexota bacterium]